MLDTDKPKKRVAIYIRVSTNEQKEMYWPELQMRACKNFILARENEQELAEDHIYIDEGISWTTDWTERAGLSKLMNILQMTHESKRPFDAVIVYRIDRFARNLRVLLSVIDELSAYGVDFISANESIDTSTPFGKAMLGIIGVFAELERNSIQERTWDAKKTAVEKWSWMSDVYGYRRHSVDKLKRPHIHKQEANVVKQIFDWYANDLMSVSAIMQKLRDEKIPIPAISNPKKIASKKIQDPYFWRLNTVASILSNEVYTGKYYYNKTRLEKDKRSKKSIPVRLPKSEWLLSTLQHEKIIDEDLFERAQLLLSEKKWEQRQAEELYILSGLLKCDCCKEHHPREMMGWRWTKDGTVKMYKCSGKESRKSSYICPAMPINKDELEYIVLTQIQKIFAKPEVLESHIRKIDPAQKLKARQEKDLEKIKSSREKLSCGLDNVKDMYATWDLEKLEFESKKQSIQKQLQAFDIKILELQTALEQTADVAEHIQTLHIMKTFLGNMDFYLNDRERCSMLLKLFIDHIIVYSKPLEKWMKAAGRKKEWQQRPFRIKIVFKLPDDFLDTFYDTPFTPNDSWTWGSDSGKWPWLHPNSDKTDAKPSQKGGRGKLNALFGAWITCKVLPLTKKYQS